MSKEKLIFSIETSCDDTSVAIINDKKQIISNIIINQNNEHKLYKGVVPEIAARSHFDNLEMAIDLAIKEARAQNRYKDFSLKDVDVIAATCGPGLIGGVIVGSMFAKTIASVFKKPFIAVNHLEGHALTAGLSNDTKFPYLLLLISGGHTQFIAVMGLGDYHIIGSTIDDAAGEAFDKLAKMLDLGFPGGPEVERYAKNGDVNAFSFPTPLYHEKNCNFSFSGLKTAVRNQILKIGTNITRKDKENICASFQFTVAKVMNKKIDYAKNLYENLLKDQINDGVKFNQIVIAGGVASNKYLRESLDAHITNMGYDFIYPPINLCTDNAAMIAYVGMLRFNAGKINDVTFKPRSNWSLEDL